MAISRPFSYNTGSPIAGTTQVGSLAVGTPTSGFTGMEWWNGPDEEAGYVIAQSVSGDTQPTPISGVTASVGFFRTNGYCDSSFVSLANQVSNQSYTGATQASSGLTSLGYWNSYSSCTGNSISLNNLIAYYRFDGNGNDSSGNGINLSTVGSPTYDTGRYCEKVTGNVSNYFTGGAGQFPPTSATSKDLSVSFWWGGYGIDACSQWPRGSFSRRWLLQYKQDAVAPNTNPGWYSHIYQDGANTWQIGCFVGNKELLYTFATGSGANTPGCKGVGLTHYTFTYNNTTFDLKLYYNGQVVNSANTISAMTVTQSSIPLQVINLIGAVSTHYFFIDELSIWNRVLSDSEVQTLATSQCPLIN